ncbi:SNARE associated Golgi protein-like protein [Thermocrinis albus DSM 14484]|uniref:SNARE associated Golgi protein-like protein n=1 Tax=Thermocrinis albus (strain DSM 14484 / JCM 11386 / HI 11/12) TaxID=638303 RepID=D3SM12_THEAH|nr:VTT domain-containing protein [Thermocrinis albus]ADC89792.1 SNARE associated Golgi protein-like protein [Thermocrinis albus DSM 14484]
MLEVFFPELKKQAEEWVQHYGYTALFILSFTESVLQPVPPFPFITAAPLFKLDPYVAGLVALVGNVLGALVAYFLARYVGEGFVRKLLGEKRFLKGEALFNRYGFWAVLIGEPYKLVCWLSGIFGMPLWRFLLASLIARGVRIAFFVFWGDLLRRWVS